MGFLFACCADPVSPYGYKAWQSSTAWEGTEAYKAIDGNTNTDWSGGSCTHTAGEDKPWLAIDLGEAAAHKVVSAVTIFNRADCCSGKFVQSVSGIGFRARVKPQQVLCCCFPQWMCSFVWAVTEYSLVVAWMYTMLRCFRKRLITVLFRIGFIWLIIIKCYMFCSASHCSIKATWCLH